MTSSELLETARALVREDPRSAADALRKARDAWAAETEFLANAISLALFMGTRERKGTAEGRAGCLTA